MNLQVEATGSWRRAGDAKGSTNPLVMPRLLPDGSLEEPTEMRLVLRPDGRLEVESEIGALLGLF